MKIKNMLFIILSICMILIINSTEVIALMARYSYNPTNVIVFKIMRFAIKPIILGYIIVFIVYLKKSKDGKNKKIKKVILWLVITIAILIGLLLGSQLVLEAGKVYTSNPVRKYEFSEFNQNR